MTEESIDAEVEVEVADVSEDRHIPIRDGDRRLETTDIRARIERLHGSPHQNSTDIEPHELSAKNCDAHSQPPADNAAHENRDDAGSSFADANPSAETFLHGTESAARSDGRTAKAAADAVRSLWEKKKGPGAAYENALVLLASLAGEHRIDFATAGIAS
eukprot:2045216-Rhodomonas_salina.2